MLPRRTACLVIPVLLLSGCFSDASDIRVSSGPGITNDRTKFSQREYGVAASPRVTRAAAVRKGGGRRMVGKPYVIRGVRYTPREEPGYDRTGMASWYGPNFHGRLTANGEVYDQFALSAAHPTFPLPSYARVTSLATGASVIVRVNDRGPFHSNRIIDLSARASELLDYQREGVARVRVQYLGDAPLHGRDGKMLAASFRRDGGSRLAQADTGPDDVDPIVVASVKAKRAHKKTPPSFRERLRRIFGSGKDDRSTTYRRVRRDIPNLSF